MAKRIRRVDVTTPQDILHEIDRLRELASAQREWGAVSNYDTLRVWLRSEPSDEMGRDTPGDEGKERTQWKDRYPTPGVNPPSTTTTRSRGSVAGKQSLGRSTARTTAPSPTTPTPHGSIARSAGGCATSGRSRTSGGAASVASPDATEKEPQDAD